MSLLPTGTSDSDAADVRERERALESESRREVGEVIAGMLWESAQHVSRISPRRDPWKKAENCSCGEFSCLVTTDSREVSAVLQNDFT